MEQSKSSKERWKRELPAELTKVKVCMELGEGGASFLVGLG